MSRTRMHAALLALTEVIAKDWVERNLALDASRRALRRGDLHPWLATAALGSGSSAGVFSLVSSEYYSLDEGGVKATCRCDSYGGWCAVADRVFEPGSGRYAWRVQLAAPGKSGLFICGVCVHAEPYSAASSGALPTALAQVGGSGDGDAR